jgi:hypothetical protein
MTIRDNVSRIIFRWNQDCPFYRIRRLKCLGCGRIHRELPNFVLPFKNYDAQTVQETLDLSSDNCCGADNSTMQRWKRSFLQSQSALIALLVSCWMKMEKSAASLFNATHILSQIKSKQKNWLSFVIQLLINFGCRPCTGFAFCP